jgi:hypothetical protein
MVLLVIYILALFVFWMRAQKLTPARYPDADPAALATWRKRKLMLYRRYAAFFIIWLALAFTNTILIHHGHGAALRHVMFITLLLTSIFMFVVFVYITFQAYKTYKLKPQLHKTVESKIGI